jgi:hypothetical protein
VVIVAVLAACAAGCGGRTAAPPATTHASTRAMPAHTPRARRELAQLHADVRRIKLAAAHVKHSLMGSPKLLEATGRFLDDEERASLDDLTKNRMISLAASEVAGSCDQCIQQLEANRPVAGSMKTH